MSSLYEILSVENNADQFKIRKAYLKLCLKYHPDKGGDAEEFKKLNAAYELLSDDTRRHEYDIELSRTKSSPEPTPQAAESSYDSSSVPTSRPAGNRHARTTSSVRCKFGINCTRPDCFRAHPRASRACPEWKRCQDRFCVFRHPPICTKYRSGKCEYEDCFKWHIG